MGGIAAAIGSLFTGGAAVSTIATIAAVGATVASINQAKKAKKAQAAQIAQARQAQDAQQRQAVQHQQNIQNQIDTLSGRTSAGQVLGTSQITEQPRTLPDSPNLAKTTDALKTIETPVIDQTDAAYDQQVQGKNIKDRKTKKRKKRRRSIQAKNQQNKPLTAGSSYVSKLFPNL